MADTITAEDIIAAIDNLQNITEDAERKRFEQLKAEGEITEACLVVHPNIAIHLKKAMYEANIHVQMIITRLAPLDKIYVLTDRELISRINRNRGLEILEEARQQE